MDAAQQNHETTITMSLDIVNKIYPPFELISDEVKKSPGSRTLEALRSEVLSKHTAFMSVTAGSSYDTFELAVLEFLRALTSFLMQARSEGKIPEQLLTKFDELTILKSELSAILLSHNPDNASHHVTRELYSRILSVQDQVNRYQSRMSNISYQLEMVATQANAARGLVESLDAVIEEKVKQAVMPVSEAAHEIKKSYDETILSLVSSRKKVADLVSAVANEAMSSSHLKDSETQKKLADNFRIYSIAWMLFATVFSVHILLQLLDEQNPKPSYWLTRMVLIFVITIPGAFFARESAKHREREAFSHRTGISLLALNPYTQDMLDDRKNDVKAELAKSFFGWKVEKRKSSSPEMDLNQIIDAIVKLRPTKE